MSFARIPLMFLMVVLALASARAVEVRFINWDGDASDLKFTNKGKTITVRAAESSLSPVYVFDGPGPLVLFKEAVVEGAVVRQTAATLEVPAGMTHGIVVLAATDAEANAYAGVWIDDAPEVRPKDSIRLVNLSSHTLAFKVDATEFMLAPSGNHQIPVRSNTRRVLMQAATKVEGQWKIVANNPLPVRSGLRVLVLLRNGRAQEGSEVNIVDLLSFYDLPPELPAGAGPGGRATVNVTR